MAIKGAKMNKLNQRGEGGLGAVVVILILVIIIGGVVWLINANNNRNTTRGRGDAEVGQVHNDPRDVYQMPDRFGNVSMFCDKYGNAVYTTTSDPNRSLHTLKDGCE